MIEARREEMSKVQAADIEGRLDSQNVNTISKHNAEAKSARPLVKPTKIVSIAGEIFHISMVRAQLGIKRVIIAGS